MVLTSGPNRPCCRVVWFAPVPNSSGGRSAVTTSSGSPAWYASIIAGCMFPAAVPEVHTTAAKPVRLWRAPNPLLMPSARKAAERSSTRTCNATRPASAASCSA